MIDEIPAGRPLTAVVHTAGVLDDGVISALDGERLERVMGPKLDAAVHLHELTEGLELSEFVLYSSAAATLGSPGQANYAAANTFLDALAQVRRSRGLAGQALAFGVWETATGMTSHLSESDSLSSGPVDLLPMGDEFGMELIDVARMADEALLLPMRLDLGALRARARSGVLPALLSELVSVPARSAQASSSLARMLAAAQESERDQLALELVCSHAAAVLGHSSAGQIDRDRPFKELGFDSLSALEVRNRIAQASGLKLPATLIFDHPTPAAVAVLLRELAEGQQQQPGSPPAPAAPAVGVDEDPIVIVGMACRYPGGVRSAEELWSLVAAGEDTVGEFPTDRGWDLERLFDPDPERSGDELYASWRVYL